MSNSLQEAVARAVAAEGKARDSKDPNDYVAAETAYYEASRAAYRRMEGCELRGAAWEKLAGLGKDLSDTAGRMKRKANEILSELYAARKAQWATREVMSGGAPPPKINVLDQHGGFTAVTSRGTLWRPSNVLKRGHLGTLVEYDSRSFYQTNDDATKALYKGVAHRTQKNAFLVGSVLFRGQPPGLLWAAKFPSVHRRKTQRVIIRSAAARHYGPETFGTSKSRVGFQT